MIVTISREYGAAGLDVAQRVGELLGYRVAGDDLPKIAVAPPSLAERILHNLGSAAPESHAAVTQQTLDSETRKEIEAGVLEAAQERDIVIVGGLANIILRGRPNLLSVFLHAPLEFRIGRIMESLNIDADAARKEIERVDGARRRWAKTQYDMVWGRSEYYSLTIDVSRFGVDGAAGLIADALARL